LCAVQAGSSAFVPVMAWQYRNAGLISSTYPHAKAENHAIVTFSGRLPISEFLIVGCQHGWLYGIGSDRGDSSKP
jgi:hypothetical protein